MMSERTSSSIWRGDPNEERPLDQKIEGTL